MKKIILSALALSLGVSSWAEYSMLFHGSDGKVASYKCSEVDSVKTDGVSLRLHGANVTEIPFASLDSLTFSLQTSVVNKDTVFVVYKDGKAEVINPFKGEIEVTTDGAGVTAISSVVGRDVVYALSGKSSNGYFLVDSEKKFKVVLDNLDLTSTGVVSPIRSLSGKGMTLVLKGKNSLTDSAKDTCNAVIRSKGQIIFGAESGNNTLVVNAKQKRAIQSGDYVVVEGGNIEATSTLGNCVRTNDYFLMTGGTMLLNEGTLNVTNGYFQMEGGELTIVSSQEGAKLVDIETELLDEDGLIVADETHGAFSLIGGTLNLTAKGAGSRAVKTDGDILVRGGSIVATLSAPSLYDAADGVTNAMVIKAGGKCQIVGGKHTLTVTSKADGARVLGADGKVIFGGKAIVSLRNEASLFNYVTEKGNAKTKSSAVIKSDAQVEFNECSVIVQSTASDKGAMGISTRGDIIVNEGADVKVSSVSVSAVGIDEEGSGSLISNGGCFVASCVKNLAFSSCAVQSKGGVVLGFSPYKHNSGFTGSSHSVFMDQTYDNKPFAMESASGKALILHQGAIESIEKGWLFMAAPYVSGEEYTYRLGGTISGTASSAGFVTDGKYSGGESYTISANRAGSSYSISKE